MSTTQQSIRSDTRVDVAAATALVVFWSSGFVGARLGTEYAPADTLLAWRYLATMAILLPFVAGRLRRLGPRTIGRVRPGRSFRGAGGSGSAGRRRAGVLPVAPVAHVAGV